MVYFSSADAKTKKSESKKLEKFNRVFVWQLRAILAGLS
jgi:hypothetical protein